MPNTIPAANGVPNDRPDQPIVLQVEGVTKRFPGILANDNINLTLHRGEILALLGENGAGKSTLMNIIYGLYHPDEGHIQLKGKDIHFTSPREAIHSGIGMVHQHFQLIPVMTVAENVILGEETTVSSRRDALQATEDTAAAGSIRWAWGVLWRALTPVMAASIGLLMGFVVLLLILTISTYLPQGAQFQSFSYDRLDLLPKSEMALSAIYATNPTTPRVLLWLPLLIGSLVGAIMMVLAYRHARQTWRGRTRLIDQQSGFDTVIDAVIDLFATSSTVQNRGRAAARVRELSRQFNLEVDPDAIIEELPVGAQQRVEIVKALYRHADILILDEPTAVLTPQEGQELFKIMRELAAQGVSIIFITHKLKEVFAVADSIVVMRAGKVAGATVPASATESSLASLMVGREVLLRVAKAPAQPKEAVLTVENLRVLDERRTLAIDGVSFEVHAGEVLGIAGVQGNGQTELVEVLTGLRKPAAGSFRIGATTYYGGEPRDITSNSTGHVPEDRQRFGMVMTFPVADNLVLNQYYNAPFSTYPSMGALPLALAIYGAIFAVCVGGLVWLWTTILWPALQSSLQLATLTYRKSSGPFLIALFAAIAYIVVGMVAAHLISTVVSRITGRVLAQRNHGGLTMDEDTIGSNAQRLIKEFDIRTPSASINGGNLSGGNQQKMVVAREFSRKPHLLIAAQPTRGIDVGSIEFIHQRIIQQRDAGAAVLLVSAELDEITALSDRIAVMYKGQIIDVVSSETATREQLGLLMAGVKVQPSPVPA